MRRSLSQNELREIAAIAVISTADVFLGPAGRDAIIAGMERRASRAQRRTLGLGTLGTKPTPTPGIPTPAEYEATTWPIDPDVNAILKQRALEDGDATEETWHDVRMPSVTPAVVSYLMDEFMKMGMMGLQPPFDVNEIANSAGSSGMDLVLSLYGREAAHLPGIGTELAQRVARMLGIPWGIMSVYHEVWAARQAARKPAGGIIGKAISAITDAIQWDKVHDLKSWLNSTLRLAALVYGAAAAGSAIGGGGASAGTTSTAAASPAASGAAATAAPAATATGAASGTVVTTAATAGSGVIKAVVDKAKEIAPKVVEGVNTIRTIDAVKDGEVPPPPIDIGSGSMTDWASAIAEQYVAGQLSDAQKKALEQQIRLLQSDAAPYALPGQYGPSSQVPPEVQQAMLTPQPLSNGVLLALAIGVPALFFVLSEARQ